MNLPATSDSDESSETGQTARPLTPEQRRRIDAVFGSSLPAVTDDERDPGERSGLSREYYEAQRPPHHGG